MTAETSSTVPLTMQVDKNIYEAFGELCHTMNVSFSTGIDALMKKAIREQKLDFDFFDENGFTQEEVNELLRRIKDVDSGRVERHSLIEE